jgi:hypothetical protein
MANRSAAWRGALLLNAFLDRFVNLSAIIAHWLFPGMHSPAIFQKNVF